MASVPLIDLGRPWCALCGSATIGRVRTIELSYGVVVQLCAPHATPAFLTRDDGRAAAVALHRAWVSAGCLNQRRRRALEAHVQRVRSARAPAERARPGSYAWPDLRHEVLRRRDSGQRFERVMEWVRQVCTDGRTSPPSAKTVRRWWRQPASATLGTP